MKIVLRSTFSVLCLLMVSACIYALPSSEEHNKSTSTIVSDAMSSQSENNSASLNSLDSYDNPLADIAAPETIEEKFSYAYAYISYLAIEKQGFKLDGVYFAKGALDAMYNTGIYNEAQLNQILSDMQSSMLSQESDEIEKIAADNLEDANNYLVMNKELSGVKVTSSGLQYKVLVPGSGASPVSGQQVTLNYQIQLMDGTLVGQSDGDAIYSVDCSIPGFTEGLKLMKVGSKYRFWVHPDLAYGKQGANNIEPNSLLIFDVELKSIEDESVESSLKIN
ncbi:MAG: FKBP-type peptidyl-prolyl cis-trans isomerase [Sphaerochaetaceae bacterium]|nr:FKBP-type peptidyl-prolyl cis-trans isomerase [Sphaerochaetaceae bacterium]